MSSKAVAAILVLGASASASAADLAESYNPAVTGAIGGLSRNAKVDCQLLASKQDAPGNDSAEPNSQPEQAPVRPLTVVEQDFLRFKTEQAARACAGAGDGSESEVAVVESLGGIGSAGEAVPGGSNPEASSGGGGASSAISAIGSGGGGGGGRSGAFASSGGRIQLAGPSSRPIGGGVKSPEFVERAGGNTDGRTPGATPTFSGENPRGTAGGHSGAGPHGPGAAVPGPVAGAGLPALLAMLGLWKFRRRFLGGRG